MGKKTLFHGRPKWLLLCLSLFACAVGVVGATGLAEDNALTVKADVSTVTKDCIGITLIDKVNWSGYENDPYIFIYSATWADGSPYSAFADFTTEKDGLTYDSGEGALRLNAVWYEPQPGGGYRYYTIQMPWYIATCTYLWKRGVNEHYYAVDSEGNNLSASAGHTYADYLYERDDNAQKGTVSQVSDPGEDNLATSSVSTTGNAVSLYYVVGGSKSESVSETRYVWPGEHTPVFADIASPDSDHEFNGFYFAYDAVFGFDNKWTTNHLFSNGDVLYVDFRLKGDDYSTGIYLIDDTTPSVDGIPTEGKMFYKSHSSEPYEYYLTKHFNVGDVFLFFDAEHYAVESAIQYVYYSTGAVLGSYFVRLGDGAASTYTNTMCGQTVHYAFQCLIEGTYTIEYAYKASSRGIRKVEDANQMEYVYFLKNTATWGDDNVYCYMYNSATKSPAGGSSNWPGCRVGNGTTELKVTRTGHIKASYDSKSISYIYRVAYYPKIGNPDMIIFNNGKSDGTETIGTDKTGNLPLTTGRCYQFKRNGTGAVLSAPVSLGPTWLYDFDDALGDASYDGDDFEDSVCAIINDTTLATSLYSRYSSMASTGKGVVDSAVIYTYDPEDPDPEDGDVEVPFSTVITLLTERLGSGGSARYIGPKDAGSPLTMTLWIVVGTGLAGLISIGAAYWASKKKKRSA